MDRLVPHRKAGPFVHEGTPLDTCVGLRVAFLVEGVIRYGRVTAVQGRNLSIDLEKRWNHRARVIINWFQVRIADEQISPAPEEKFVVDPQRINALRQKVFDTTRSLHGLSHYNDTDALQLSDTCHSIYETLHEYLQNFEAMRVRIRSLVQEFHDSIDRSVAYGIDPGLIPPRVESIRDVDVKIQGRRQKGGEARRRLTQARERTRDLLVALLHAAGEEGVTSEEVVAALCGIGAEEKNGLPITQHRVMGMLSALSRRGEAEMIPQNKWRATKELLG